MSPTVDGNGIGDTVVVTVSLGAAVAVDRALNDNEAATDLVFTFDNKQPGVTVTSAETLARTALTPIPVTFTWTEDVTGFTSDLVTCTLDTGTCAKSAMTSLSATVWTFEITPSTEGNIVVQVPAAVLQDQVSDVMG